MNGWMGAAIEAFLGSLLIAGTGFSLILVAVLTAGAEESPAADAGYCIATYPECLNRDVLEDLAQAGAEDWELAAALAVAHGRQGRGMVTFTDVSCGSAGFASFAPGPSRSGADMGRRLRLA